ncbi:hypothetical protein ACFVU3_05630 [Streptomyces sp. NPDC058052]|uniref:hypothetical protein n=1 Tax=Streptomyces sp. NPDC058052 TaxID=3346316 RepID=UPI0036EBC34F
MDGTRSPGSGPRSGFRLLDVSLHTEERGRIAVALGAGARDAAPLVLGEGTVVSVGLTFRLGLDVDALVFEEERVRDGRAPVSHRTPLGGFRRGGPYEVRLPPQRMPVGKAHCGLYRVTGRLTDGHGRELARVDHHVRLVHLSGTPKAAPGAAQEPSEAAQEPSEMVQDPTEAARGLSGAAQDSPEMVQDPTEAAQDSPEAARASSASAAGRPAAPA